MKYCMSSPRLKKPPLVISLILLLPQTSVHENCVLYHFKTHYRPTDTGTNTEVVSPCLNLKLPSVHG